MKELDEETLKVWYGYFKDVPYDVMSKAIGEIAKESNSFPNAPIIRKKCDEINKSYLYSIVEIMKKDGYFRKGVYGELSDEQALKNYEKILSWMEQNIIPDWFKEDMKLYMNKQTNKLVNKNTILIDNKVNICLKPKEPCLIQ